MTLDLTSEERSLLHGERGGAAALAMRLVVALARMSGAERLLPIESAHVDSCLFHGQAGLDFAERLVAGGAEVVVPTTLNVSSLDLLHPERFRGDAETRSKARALMDAYLAMGCRPTWTCAPYQLLHRPAFGSHIAWAESNAIVFANSVLGARTDRYGDFIDICAALTGRVPDAGLHRTEARRGQVVFDLGPVPGQLLADPVLFPTLGHLVGERAETRVPVLVGLPDATSEDDLKALGAGAASSGGVALFHAVGITPEAPSLEAALADGPAEEVVLVTGEMLRDAYDDLTTAAGGELAAVSIGTPHLSLAEFERLAVLADGAVFAVPFYVNTARDVLAEVDRRGWLGPLDAAGVVPVVDTCTYITPILDVGDGVVMTDSAKWAYYAPGNLGVDVVFARIEDCVRSAVAGRIVRDETVWEAT
ncbi:MAG: aconitase X [Nitriliruptorales bacterium]